MRSAPPHAYRSFKEHFDGFEKSLVFQWLKECLKVLVGRSCS